MSYICMVVDGSYPNDIRVRKEAEALAESGKKVLVVCPARKDDINEEVINKVLVYRFGSNYSHIQKGVFDIVESVFDVNPLFKYHLNQVFKKYPISVLHIHDLPLAGTGYQFKSKVNCLILDLHENYPEALKTWFSWKNKPLIRIKNILFFNFKNWSKKEHKYCEKYDKVICVVEEMKQKLISNFNINPKKLYVVSNHEKKSFQDVFSQKNSQKIIKKNVFSITYVGGFGPHRGLDTAIIGMIKIVEMIPNAKLFLIGKGSKDVQNKLQNIVRDNNLDNCVQFVGYRPFEEISTIMKESSINIIPHKSDEHTDNTIPHKLFQIMMSKSFLLVSSCKPLKRIVEKYDAGFVFEANNSNDFVAKVVYIYNNERELKYKTKNAYDAVMNGENWEVESLKLIKLYDDLKN